MVPGGIAGADFESTRQTHHSVRAEEANGVEANGGVSPVSVQRGKFRPRLQQLAASNAEDAVQKRSRTAMGLLPDVPAAVAELSGLRGVGPATASAVLAAAAPALTAFMSDEAAESVPGLQPVQYTAKHYALYLDKMANQAAKLNAVDPQQDWTPHRLEMCLWATATATKLQLPVLEDLKGGDTQSSDCDQRPAKKLKTA
ncbi:PREDICTED: uncharacterized protein LOC106903573 isoform X2 [Poecilia mexicana]|uniref:uncharacterized protein LOC106903573 isoform X2 n=1 Tax=Poecilia mexicana TaxID=48701 RepID=UPI00072EAEAD|nr:PREDICTED: uncharacterized protein LOC106903573 isoform X2 [Poecilia mexicana]